MFLILALVFGLALIFGPRVWIGWTLATHGRHRPDFPGTGAELARHLLDEAGLHKVKVEATDKGDHYSPEHKAVRLSPKHFGGRSVSAAAVAAHEVGHALQDAQDYRPLRLRHRLAGAAIAVERTGSLLMLATPLVFLLTRSPIVLVAEIIAAFGILASTVVIHVLTLPTEFDASFRRALPALEIYLHSDDLPGARSVLRAAAFTYVAAALVSLLDIARWIRVLRF